MRTVLIYHPIYLQHDTGPHHPERASRLQAILRKFKKTGIIDKVRLVEPQAASLEDIELVHGRDYILSIREICSRLCQASADKYASLDPDTVVSKDSFEAALYAAGGVIYAAGLVMEGDTDNAFCLVRPPGHHAEPSRAMGFCLFNNIAIGARSLQKRYNLKRILIVDWDVHHGNGTEKAFYGDSEVLYISLHQYPHYPGTGSEKDIGEAKGRGFNLNIPMAAGSGDPEYIKTFNEIIVPRINEFKPEFVLISAGFDGHKDDPLSGLTLTESGYSEMTYILKECAKHYSKNRIVSVLEGGYNLVSLANSAQSHLEGLLS